MRNSETPSPTGLTSPGKSQAQAIDADLNARLRLPIAELAEPAFEQLRLPQFGHAIGSHRRHVVNRDTIRRRS